MSVAERHAEEILDGSFPLLAIVRYREGGDVCGVLDILAAVGFELLGVTLDTPGALEAVATGVGLGGQLVGRSAPRGDGELEEVGRRAAAAIALARGAA